MSQTLHLLEKDLRIMRLPLALLYALLLAQTFLALRDPIVVDNVIRLTDGLFQLLSLLAMLVTTGLLVHQEPLVGTTAFWLTRPIRRRALLTAKALFLMLFVAGPLAVATVGVACAFGLGLADLPAALGSILMPLAALLIVALVLAAITPNIVAYLMTWIGLLFGTHLVSVLGGLLIDGDSDVVSSASKDLVWMAALVVFGWLLAAHQYLTGRTHYTIVGISMALFASVAISEGWRWEIVEWTNPLFEQSPVGLTLSPGTQGGAFNASRRSDDEITIGASAIFTGHPSLDFEVQAVRGELQLSDGSPIPLTAEVLPTRTPDSITGLEGFQWLDGHGPAPPTVLLRTQGEETLSKLVESSGALKADVYGLAYRFKLAGTIPLEVDERLEKGAVAAVIREISEREEERRIVLRYRFTKKSSFQNTRFPHILLVNNTRREMSLPNTTKVRYFQPSGVFPWGPLVVSREETYTLPLRARAGGPPALSSDWLADAELAILEWVPEGRYQTTLRLTDFQTRDATFDRQALTSSIVD